MKVAVIGGGGRVGSDAAYALQLGGIVREIVLVDANAEMAAGEALDILHGSAYSSPQKISSGDYSTIADSDCIVITAGLRRKPDESRLELINRNVTLFQGILNELQKISLNPNAKILVVSNPVDILTQLAIQTKILPSSQILGLGTVLDTSRFRSLIAEQLNVNATDISALILGEHGDSMVPIWSSATLAGVPLQSLPAVNEEWKTTLFDRTKKSGAEVISRKGGAGRAVGISIKVVVEAIALDSRAILPVSSLQNGIFGIQDVCLSLPTVVGKRGVVEVITPHVTEEEKKGIQASAESLKGILSQMN